MIYIIMMQDRRNTSNNAAFHCTYASDLSMLIAEGPIASIHAFNL